MLTTDSTPIFPVIIIVILSLISPTNLKIITILRIGIFGYEIR